MKSLRYFPVLLLFLVACSKSGSNDSPEAPVKTTTATIAAPGKIMPLIIVGNVSLIDSTGKSSPLQKGIPFTAGNTIVTDSASGTTVVFSNGATFRVKENSRVKVVKFIQAPFDAAKEGEFIRLARDPSHSETVVEIQNGTLQGEVKQLNKAAGSTFKIITKEGKEMDAEDYLKQTISPVANSGGTASTNTISISLTPTANGSVNVEVSGGNPATQAQVRAQVEELFAAINNVRADQKLPLVAPATIIQAST